jgi:hypothetical protein
MVPIWKAGRAEFKRDLLVKLLGLFDIMPQFYLQIFYF